MGVLSVELGEKFLGYVVERLARRVEGLTDDECRWEPTPDAWNIRLGADGRWHADLGPKGTPALPDAVPPFTTFAWRLWHLGASPNPTWPPAAPATARD